MSNTFSAIRLFTLATVLTTVLATVLATALSAQAIRGLIVDPAGQPVAGVRIELIQSTSLRQGRYQIGGRIPIARGTTSKRGRRPSSSPNFATSLQI